MTPRAERGERLPVKRACKLRPLGRLIEPAPPGGWSSMFTLQLPSAPAGNGTPDTGALIVPLPSFANLARPRAVPSREPRLTSRVYTAEIVKAPLVPTAVPCDTQRTDKVTRVALPPPPVTFPLAL